NARLNRSAGMLLELPLDAVGGRAHTGLEVVPVLADHVPIDHRGFPAGGACREAIAGAAGRGIVLIDAPDGHSHSEDNTDQHRLSEPPSPAPHPGQCAAWSAPER